MSAICGVLLRSESVPPPAVVEASLRPLVGCDRGGHRLWVEGGVGFGWLTFVDPPNEDGEELPVSDAETGLALTADVRLDNRDELCEALDISSTERHGLSDSRLILRAWRKWRGACANHLIGDFAFAIWDRAERTLFCARDHIGARPLFYSLSPDRFVFASDIKRILSVSGISARLDEQYVAERLSGRDFARTHRTYIAAVHRLPPGHSLTVHGRGEHLARYWNPNDAPAIRFTADADYAHAARDIVVRSVCDRLRTRRAVGVHLSGGLDSSSVAVLTAREQRRLGKSPPVGFCWQPPPGAAAATSLHEHTFVQAICDQEGLTPCYCPVTVESILAVLRKDSVLEPITPAAVTEDVVLQLAGDRGVGLILAGLGGDEGISFNARGYYGSLLLSGRWRRFYNESAAFRPRWRFIVRELRRLLAPKRPVTTSLVNRDLASQVQRRRRTTVRATDTRATMVRLWEQAHLTDHIESWGANGAARGVQYAYPLLDRRLLEFVVGVPLEQFVGGGRTRCLMRRAMQGVLPPEVLEHANKTDAVRSEHFFFVSRQALSAIGRQLEARPTLPERARYLDMPRLLQTLRPETVRQHRVGKLMSAVMFLDF